MQFRWKEESGENMKIHDCEGVIYLTFPKLDQCAQIYHGFTTRMGGVSQGIYASMNLSYARGDDPEAVTENFRRIGEAIGFPVDHIVSTQQTHTTNVRVVTRQDAGNGIVKPLPYQDVDGLVTNESNLTLAAFFADCVPLYFVDPVHHAIGLSHSGWRGTVGRIGKQTITLMQEAYGSVPEEMIAAIGPSICQDCYEVSKDVILRFQDVFARHDWPDLYVEKSDGKYQLDLWKANELILLDSGITPAHLAISNLCTSCNAPLLFSHRATGGRRGNLAAFLGLY